MKKTLLVAVLFISTVSFSQNVGISNSSPSEKLHVDSGNIKVGAPVWSTAANDKFIKFGDADFVRLGEAGADDRMELYARYFMFKPSSAGYTGNVGIGTSAVPTAKLEVNGTFKLTDGTQAVNKVLASDASGNASWQTVGAVTPHYAFNANNGGLSQSIPNAIFTTLSFATGGTETFDVGGNFNYLTNTFTAQTTGTYHLDLSVTWLFSNSFGGSQPFYMVVYKNGFSTRFTIYDYFPYSGSSYRSQSMGFDIQLNTGSTITVSVYQGTGASQTIYEAHLSGHLLF